LSASRSGRFTPGEDSPVPIWYEAGWAPESVWTRWIRENVPAPAGNRTPVVHPAAQSVARNSECRTWVWGRLDLFFSALPPPPPPPPPRQFSAGLTMPLTRPWLGMSPLRLPARATISRYKKNNSNTLSFRSVVLIASRFSFITELTHVFPGRVAELHLSKHIATAPYLM